MDLKFDKKKLNKYAKAYNSDKHTEKSPEIIEDNSISDTLVYIEEEKAEKLNNSNVIKNISFDQSEILYNIMQLYNNGEPFDCDMTASELKFYNGKGQKYPVPEPKILFDVFPLQDKIKKIVPFQPLPLEDNSIGSIVFDPPFIVSPKTAPSVKENKKGSNMIFNRFFAFYPVSELYYNYYFWIKECYRVLKPDGILIGKFGSSISGGYSHWSEEWAFMAGMNTGFYIIDKFILEAKARLISSSKIKKQKHARKYTSVFYVFQKNTKMHNKFDYFNMLKEMDSKDLHGMEWEVK